MIIHTIKMSIKIEILVCKWSIGGTYNLLCFEFLFDPPTKIFI